MHSNLAEVRIVLVRPRNPLNLLVAGRAAANFGISEVVVVAPHPPVWAEALEKAEAERWLRHARMVPSLAEAVADCRRVLGTSCLNRRILSEEAVIPLRDLPRLLKVSGGRTALVFGSEKRGLSNADLARCQGIVNIPTSEICPSMNLGQAVAVCCYEVSRARPERVPKTSRPRSVTMPATIGEMERLLEAVNACVPSTAPAHDRARRDKLRRTLLRWSPRSRDVALLLGVFRDIYRLIGSGGASPRHTPSGQAD